MVIKDIETGVDKLVSLIERRKSIELNSAAQELGVSVSVLREWAEFLEEEGVISIEYGLSKVTLSEKKLSKKEAESKVKEYHSKKDAFVRKVETTLKSLERETEEFDVIKDEFENLKTKIGDEMQDVKRELDELKHYEDLKQNIDNDISRQKEEYVDLMDKARKEMQFEENKYAGLVNDINKEREVLDKEKKEVLQLEQKEDHLRKRVEAIYGIIKSIEKNINVENDRIENSEEHILRLERMATKIEESIKDKKKNFIEPLIKNSMEQAEKISVVQNSIIKKVKQKQVELENYSKKGQDIADKFSKFFEKKMRTENLLKKITEDKHSLEEELKNLIKKAKSFEVLSKKSDAGQYIKELMKTYDKIEQKKSLLRKKLEQLSKLVGN